MARILPDAAADTKLLDLLTQGNVSDALTLFNSNVSAEDSGWRRRLSTFHAAAGWALFRELSFAQAFQHFMYAPDQVLCQVLSFWQRFLPKGFEPASAFREVRQPGPLAPEATDIEVFVQEQNRRKAMAGGAAPSTSSMASVALGNTALSAFLLKQRSALQSQERLPPDDQTELAKLSKVPALLQAVDTLVLKLLVEVQADDEKVQELLSQNPSCVVEDCEDFLRERGRADLLAHLWKARGRHENVLQEWSQLLRAACASGTSGRSVKEQAVQEMVGALTGAAGEPDGGRILQKYVPELLAVDPLSVLPVFTGAQSQLRATPFPLAVDEVLQLLREHDQLVLGFLEQALSQKLPALEQKHKVQMGSLYLSQVKEELRMSVDSGPMRSKLLHFLEQTDDVSHVLLPRVEEMGLHRERVALLLKEQRNVEALKVLIEDMDDLEHAEVYCHVLRAKAVSRQSSLKAAAQSGAAAGGGGSGDKVPSVFAAEPPAWARALAFGPAKSTSSTKDPSSEGHQVEILPGAAAAAAAPEEAPLLLLLKALVEAHTTTAPQAETPGPPPASSSSYKRSAQDYHDAAIHLLTTYVGHPDLSPTKVLPLLPASWTMASLADYLSKAGRMALHERRVSMLEEHLSSMAYLKTYNAWAQERMRKVTITGDKCCPVCNRRFVGKDSVSKAFAAYPNETCVHVQCQQDASICPKTGRNFADTASVFGHALGQ